MFIKFDNFSVNSEYIKFFDIAEKRYKISSFSSIKELDDFLRKNKNDITLIKFDEYESYIDKCCRTVYLSNCTKSNLNGPSDIIESYSGTFDNVIFTPLRKTYYIEGWFYTESQHENDPRVVAHKRELKLKRIING